MKSSRKKQLFVVLIVAILVVIVNVVTVSFALFNNEHTKYSSLPLNFGDIQQASFEILSGDMRTTPVEIDNHSYYLCERALGSTALETGVNIVTNNNIKTLLRVKVTLKVSNTNSSITSSNLKAVNNNILVKFRDANSWVLGTYKDGVAQIAADGTIGAGYLTSYYLYYNGVLDVGEQNIRSFISTINQAGSITDYNGYYIMAEFYSETIQATQVGAQKWMSVNVNASTFGGGEKTWYDSIIGSLS